MAAPAASPAETAPVVFFDGACPLCNRSVAFLARRDRGQRLRFAHLQGRFAARHLPTALRNASLDGSVVLLEPATGGRVSLRSAAVLRALAHTGSGWRPLGVLVNVPGIVPLLDVLYAFVARRRDAWFGRDDACALPDPSFRARFLDD